MIKITRRSHPDAHLHLVLPDSADIRDPDGKGHGDATTPAGAHVIETTSKGEIGGEVIGQRLLTGVGVRGTRENEQHGRQERQEADSAIVAVTTVTCLSRSVPRRARDYFFTVNVARPIRSSNVGAAPPLLTAGHTNHTYVPGSSLPSGTP